MKHLSGIVILTAVLAAGAVLVHGGEKMSNSEPVTITVYDAATDSMIETQSVALTDMEWKAKLSPETYRVLRQHGTERAFSCGTDALYRKEPGVYRCAGCGQDLFRINRKFDSGTGWPSFVEPIHENNIGTSTDYKIGYPRTEVHCSRCGGHLGHVFEDGPPPTGKRYCINAVSMVFVPEDQL